MIIVEGAYEEEDEIAQIVKTIVSECLEELILPSMTVQKIVLEIISNPGPEKVTEILFIDCLHSKALTGIIGGTTKWVNLKNLTCPKTG